MLGDKALVGEGKSKELQELQELQLARNHSTFFACPSIFLSAIACPTLPY